MSNERIRQLVEQHQERTRFMKFIRYCQMEGLGSSAAEDDRLYTESQSEFFSQYEEQMVTDVYLAKLIGVVNEKA
jgi:hypothetical protein